MSDAGPIFYPESPETIRDGIFARIQASAVGFKTVYRQRTFPIKDDQMPYAAVWTAKDATIPNGDSNVGEPSFFHNFTLVVDMVAAGKNDDALDATITAMGEGVRDTLLTDASFKMLFEGIERASLHYAYPKETDFIVTLLTDASFKMLFEGIERASLHYAYPKETDFIVAIATLEIEVTFRSEWPPVEENDFTQAAVFTNEARAQPLRRFDGYVTQFSIPGSRR